jgi:tetratricopeptide (TPR) repeat protein
VGGFDQPVFNRHLERERARYEDGMARLAPEQLVRIGNAAYGAGLALLMLGRTDEAADWLERAALRWRESWEHATPASWGRPIGTVKASLLAGRRKDAADYAVWALGLGAAESESPIGRYAATLALLVLSRWEEAAALASTLAGDFPREVSDSLDAIAHGDEAACAESLERVLVSFETREGYLEDVPVADTVLVLRVLALRRGLSPSTRPSPVLPPG